MTEYLCPICGKRVCDSSKELKIAKQSNGNTEKADVIIKCKVCKSRLSIKILRTVARQCADKPPMSGQVSK
jgi:DNA-directed RNA polymerase subunit RPC12/RpoP